MKLWQKAELKADEQSIATERFTVGNDRLWDLRIAPFDVQASIGHAIMLQQQGLLSQSELNAIKSALEHILLEIEAGEFFIEEHVEDVHSQVEKLLTERIGDAGKKLHTGRSRNDQVLVDIKLYLKDCLRQTTEKVIQLFTTLQLLSEKHKDVLLPGYTHFQLAMPSSFGLWFGAYAESLIDDMELVTAAYKIADKNPLGSGAGYGSAFPLNRLTTTQLLGFSEMNYNCVYAQMTRGKAEKAALIAFASIAATLSKLAYDICLYMNQQFGFISFPDSLTTGSSIMPHKKNPDIFELIRAKCNRIQALPNELAMLCNNLPSGYHRDMQLTKDILFPAVDSLFQCLEMMTSCIGTIEVRKDILVDKRYDELFTVEEINKLVIDGVPFRDAYKQIGIEVNTPNFAPERNLQHTHQGSINNLCNEEIKQHMEKVASYLF